jgi:hypothetical protein
MGLERSFKIPKDVMDVVAQTKQPMENCIHPITPKCILIHFGFH